MVLSREAQEQSGRDGFGLGATAPVCLSPSEARGRGGLEYSQADLSDFNTSEHLVVIQNPVKKSGTRTDKLMSW